MIRRDGHIPVLAEESLSLLEVHQGGRYLDATFGGGGHTRLLLEASPAARVEALDRDPSARERLKVLEQDFPGDRLGFHGMPFSRLDEVPGTFDGILFDLGVSSFQLDENARGFSFRKEAPLDMRMNPEEGLSAAEWLAQAGEGDLKRAFRDYGEERHWRRLTQMLLSMRPVDRPKTTLALAGLAEEVLPRPRGPRRIHPATKIFQGLRIAVNRELEEVAEALPKAFAKLNEGGRLVVISFHSLEDRIVKRQFKRFCGQPEHRGDSRPQQDRQVLAENITRKPVRPTAEERQTNPRSRSAILRAIRKTTP
ncbi:MAG: 16S rRNA (cytosine(1402)-N(4))-methyltransferase RsmH [Opitutales bacterium]|nr:16S rRNA (cytosine(1402)-N(4))-methyltransferase RsmH [Opitutales bacterium]MCH8539964.1 16S rRNA (cytosine(1402)-N(4))-methyltransferase RsmH [Opitutales bacterium]